LASSFFSSSRLLQAAHLAISSFSPLQWRFQLRRLAPQRLSSSATFFTALGVGVLPSRSSACRSISQWMIRRSISSISVGRNRSRPQPRGGLVDQVDGLVREEAVVISGPRGWRPQ